MNIKKTKHFALILLVSFLTSVALNTYLSNSDCFKKCSVKHTRDLIVSNSNDNRASQDNLLFEETETELEDDVEAQSFFLPFLLTYFLVEFSGRKFATLNLFAEQRVQLIYLSLHSFRI